MARPKRERDPDLAALVSRASEAPGMSMTRMARAIGVSPSSLTRSVNSESFSIGMRAKLDRFLLGHVASQGGMRDAGTSLHKLLLLLSDLQAMIPDLRDQLLAGLDPVTRIGQTSERRDGNG